MGLLLRYIGCCPSILPEETWEENERLGMTVDPRFMKMCQASREPEDLT